MSPQEVAEAKAARAAAAKQAQATALAEWQRLRERVAQATTPAVATLQELLDLHKPYLGEYSYRVECEHCLEGSYDVERAEWPCASYTIIKEGTG
jgi:nitrogen fixation protein FixH